LTTAPRFSRRTGGLLASLSGLVARGVTSGGGLRAHGRPPLFRLNRLSPISTVKAGYNKWAVAEAQTSSRAEPIFFPPADRPESDRRPQQRHEDTMRQTGPDEGRKRTAVGSWEARVLHVRWRPMSQDRSACVSATFVAIRCVLRYVRGTFLAPATPRFHGPDAVEGCCVPGHRVGVAGIASSAPDR
jgi:hypothetical protein